MKIYWNNAQNFAHWNPRLKWKKTRLWKVKKGIKVIWIYLLGIANSRKIAKKVHSRNSQKITEEIHRKSDENLKPERILIQSRESSKLKSDWKRRRVQWMKKENLELPCRRTMAEMPRKFGGEERKWRSRSVQGEINGVILRN